MKPNYTPNNLNANAPTETQHELSAHEAARKLITEAIAPYKGLERMGVLQGLRVVMYGSAVSELKAPPDIDILIIFDGVDNAKYSQIYRELPSNETDGYSRLAKIQGISHGLLVVNPKIIGRGGFAYGVELAITSTKNFKTDLSSSPNTNKKHAVGAIVEFATSAPLRCNSDNEVRELIITVGELLIPETLLTTKRIDILNALEENVRIITDPPEDRTEGFANLSRVLAELGEKNNAYFTTKESAELASAVVRAVVSIKSLSPFISKVLKRHFLCATTGVNFEMTVAEFGQLLYGKNIMMGDAPVFKIEDRRFLGDWNYAADSNADFLKRFQTYSPRQPKKV